MNREKVIEALLKVNRERDLKGKYPEPLLKQIFEKSSDQELLGYLHIVGVEETVLS